MVARNKQTGDIDKARKATSSANVDLERGRIRRRQWVFILYINTLKRPQYDARWLG